MHRSLLGFSLCSSIPNCWRKKALRARAGLLKGPLAACVGVGGLGAFFPSSTGRNAAQGSVCISEQCAQGTSWIFGGGPEKSHGCISPYLHSGEFLGYSYKSKMKRSWVLDSHPAPQERALPLPPPPLRIHPWESTTPAAPVQSLVKNPATSGTTGYICTRKQSRIRVRYWLWPLTLHTIAFWAWWLAWFWPVTASPPATQQLGRA